MARVIEPDPGMRKRLSLLDDTWKLSGACRDMDVNTFYRGWDNRGISERNAVREKELKTYCYLACNVREHCLLWALFIPEKHGVWGGMDEDERRKVRGEKVVMEYITKFVLDTAV